MYTDAVALDRHIKDHEIPAESVPGEDGEWKLGLLLFIIIIIIIIIFSPICRFLCMSW